MSGTAAQHPDGPARSRRRAAVGLLAVAGLLALGLRTPRAEEPGADSGAPRVVLLQSHSWAVDQLAFAAGGRHLISAGREDGTAVVWDVAAGRVVRRLDAGAGGAPGVALAADGTEALVARADGTAWLYDTATGARRGVIEVRGEKLTATALAAAEGLALVGDEHGALHVYRGTSLRKPRARVALHTSAIRRILVSERLEAVFTASDDGTIRRATLAGKAGDTYPGHAGPVTCLALAADADVLVSGGADGKVLVWDVHGRPRAPLVLPGASPDAAFGAAEVRGVGVGPDGRHVWAAASDGSLRTWTIEDGRAVPGVSTAVPLDTALRSLAVSPDGRTVIVGEDRGTLTRLDPDTGAVAGPFGSMPSVPDGAGLSPHLRYLGLLTWEPKGRRVFEVWSLPGGRPVWRIDDAGGASCFGFAPDDRHVAVGLGTTGVRIVDVLTGALVHLLPSGTTVRSVAWTPDGTAVVGGDASGLVTVWDAKTGATRFTLRGHTDEILAVDVSPRGDRALSVSKDETVRVWDLTTGTEAKRIEVGAYPQDGAFAEDGTRIVTRIEGQTLGIFDARTGRLLTRAPGGRDAAEQAHAEAITTIAVSPDGQRVASGSWDRTVRIWSVKTGKLELGLPGHDDDVLDLAWTPDGRHLFSCGKDRTVRLWDTGDGRLVATLVTFGEVKGPGDPDGHGLWTWCVSDGAGRFDAVARPDFPGLGWAAGLHGFQFGAFAGDRREPALLGRLLGFGPITPRTPEESAPPAPPPSVEVAPPAPGSTEVQVDVENEGGGIGPVAVRLNGREVVRDARGETVTPDIARERLRVDLAKAPNLIPGARNRVEVDAFDAHRTSRTRGAVVEFDAPGDPLPDPELWAVVCGVSDYEGAALDLGFPAHDAASFAEALSLAARGLFGPARVHVALLASPPPAGGTAATRAALAEALDVVAAGAKQNDVVVVYLAGHGIVLEGEDGGYRYLLAGASVLPRKAADVAPEHAFSGADLAEALGRVRANQRAVFLDTCAAGQVREALAASAERLAVPSDTMSLLGGRDGVYVLAGCAADRVSYESSLYGQGLLTYTLLLGLSCGCHFRDDVFVDVGRLMTFACENVPWFSRQMGLPQPQIPVKSEADHPFSIGRLTPEERARIPIAQPLPAIVRSSFQRRGRPGDPLSFRGAVDQAVRRLSGPDRPRAPMVLVETDRMEAAFQIAGTYAVEDEKAQVDVYVIRLAAKGEDDEEVAHLEVAGACGTPEAVAALADLVVARVTEALKAR